MGDDHLGDYCFGPGRRLLWCGLEWKQTIEQFTYLRYLLMTEPAGLANGFELKGRERIPKFCQLLRWRSSKDK